jgi:predicted PurR-regulated permease PerM
MSPPSDLMAVSQRDLRRISVCAMVIVIALVLTFCFLASSLCITVVLSAFLAILVDPMVSRLERLGAGRGLSAGLVLLALRLLVGLGAAGAYKRAYSIAEDLPVYTQRLQRALNPALRRIERLQQNAEKLRPPDGSRVPEVRIRERPAWPSFLIRGVGSISSFLLIAGVVPFLAYFMLVRRNQMAVRFTNMFGDRIDTVRLILDLKRMVRGYVMGNLVVGLIMASATSLLLLAVGMKGAVALGMISGALNTIPFFGLILAELVPLAAALLQFASIGPFIVIAVTVLLLHLIAGNLLVPRLIGSRVLLGPVAATVGILFWGWLWGIVGLLLAVPLTALIKLIADAHPSLIHLSNALAEEPRPIPRWVTASQNTFQRIGPYLQAPGRRRRPRS